jgi:hypothetical protein
VLQESSGCNLVVPTSYRRHIPSHRISEPVIDIEQERDFHGVLNCLLRNAGTHHCPHVLGSEAAMVQRHVLEQTERCAKRFANRRYCVFVQNLLDKQATVQC